MMAKTYDGQTARFLAAVATCMPPLSGDVMQQWINSPQDLKKALSRLALFVDADERFKEKAILALAATAQVSAIERFVAAEKFRPGKTTDGVEIAWLSGDFERHFLGKTETSVAPAVLHIYRLLQDSSDATILTELGVVTETTLAHFWELLKKRGRVRPGSLPVNECATFAYIRDKNGVLWNVSAHWNANDSGWVMLACSITSRNERHSGYEVVSR
jgi:hypothetical protein